MGLDLAGGNLRSTLFSSKPNLKTMQKIYIGNGQYLNVPYVKPTKSELRDQFLFHNLV